MSDSPAVGRRLAVIGAGPSGLYATDRITRADSTARVDLFERLPVPFGLIRYGVAPDHQGTKGTSRLLDRVLDRPNARFLGNVEIGRDVSLDALLAAYDGVLVAVGASVDRRLGIPGETLANVVGSWDFVAWLNSRPGHIEPPVDFARVRRVVLIGLGNVAIDIARVLLKAPSGFAGSDLHGDVEAVLAKTNIEQITIVGRGAITAARFGRTELAELIALPDLTVAVTPSIRDDDDGTTADLLRTAKADGSRTLSFRFETTPLAFDGDNTVSGVSSSNGQIPADLVVTCVGYDSATFCALGQTQGYFCHQDYRIADRLYVTGWAATGPRGTIPTARETAIAVADRMLKDCVARDSDGIDPPRAVNLSGARRIHAAELAEASAGRVRSKITTIEKMLALAGGEEA